ncbi:hypothetical protein RhiTH_011421 [Rhizoctonia solani]
MESVALMLVSSAKNIKCNGIPLEKHLITPWHQLQPINQREVLLLHPPTGRISKGLPFFSSMPTRLPQLMLAKDGFLLGQDTCLIPYLGVPPLPQLALQNFLLHTNVLTSIPAGATFGLMLVLANL